MSDYKRLISYIYEYEGKTKGKNIGFVKLEARNGQCRLNLNVKKVYVGGNPIGVYLLGKEGRETFLGNIFIRNGNGEFRTVVDSGNVEGTGNDLDTYYGLTIHDVKNSWRSYTTIWEDSVAHMAQETLPGAEEKSAQGGQAVSRVVKEIEDEIAREEERQAASEANGMKTQAAEVGLAEAVREEGEAPETVRKEMEGEEMDSPVIVNFPRRPQRQERKYSGIWQGPERRGGVTAGREQPLGGAQGNSPAAPEGEVPETGSLGNCGEEKDSAAGGHAGMGISGEIESRPRPGTAGQAHMPGMPGTGPGEAGSAGKNTESLKPPLSGAFSAAPGMPGQPPSAGRPAAGLTLPGRADSVPGASNGPASPFSGAPQSFGPPGGLSFLAGFNGQQNHGNNIRPQPAAGRPSAFPGQMLNLISGLTAGRTPGQSHQELAPPDGLEAARTEKREETAPELTPADQQKPAREEPGKSSAGEEPEKKPASEKTAADAAAGESAPSLPSSPAAEEERENAAVSPELENEEVLRYLRETEETAASPESLWQELRKSYPKIQPFDYDEGCEILTIRPQDIGRLPRETWIYGNNSFLLHGYYSFRYLILVRLGSLKGRPRYLLGVPGHYYSNEKYMASMFGFPNFVLSKKQPPNDGRFGYWYTDVKMG